MLINNKPISLDKYRTHREIDKESHSEDSDASLIANKLAQKRDLNLHQQSAFLDVTL